MQIPYNAYEAARDAVYAHISTTERPSWLVAVEAAAQFIAAEELFKMQTQAPGLNSSALNWLSRRRDELDPS